MNVRAMPASCTAASSGTSTFLSVYVEPESLRLPSPLNVPACTQISGPSPDNVRGHGHCVITFSGSEAAVSACPHTRSTHVLVNCHLVGFTARFRVWTLIDLCVFTVVLVGTPQAFLVHGAWAVRTSHYQTIELMVVKVQYGSIIGC
jgi:hypothetical protein